jgi:hypothetical protein
MVFSVHLQRSAVVAIVNCSVRGQFNGFRSLKQVALQSIWLFQESLSALAQANSGERAMQSAEKLSINLPPEVANFIRQKVESGLYGSNSEIIREALRGLMER